MLCLYRNTAQGRFQRDFSNPHLTQDFWITLLGHRQKNFLLTFFFLQWKHKKWKSVLLLEVCCNERKSVHNSMDTAADRQLLCYTFIWSASLLDLGLHGADPSLGPCLAHPTFLESFVSLGVWEGRGQVMSSVLRFLCFKCQLLRRCLEILRFALCGFLIEIKRWRQNLSKNL